MRIKIVYFSGTGNTKFLSEKIAEIFRKLSICDIELIPVEKAMKEIIAETTEDTILGIGYPVYDLMPPQIIMEFLEQLENVFNGQKAFVFSTYTSYPLDSNYYVIEKLYENGFQVISHDNFKAPGANAYLYLNPQNPLVNTKATFDKGINKKLYTFVTKILALNTKEIEYIPLKFNRINKLHQKFSKITFGNMFYRELKLNSNCSNCGQCASNCPANNLYIEAGNLIIRNSKGCLRCLRCVQICKRRAISLTRRKRVGDYTYHEICNAFEKSSIEE